MKPAPSRCNSKIIGVIETVYLRGSGEDQSDPVREVTLITRLDGTVIAEHDPCPPEPASESPGGFRDRVLGGNVAAMEGQLRQAAFDAERQAQMQTPCGHSRIGSCERCK